MTNDVIYHEGIPHVEGNPSTPGIYVDGRRVSVSNNPSNLSPTPRKQPRQAPVRNVRINYIIDNLEKSFKS